MANGNREMQLGLAHLAHRLQAVGLQILKQARPWPNRTVTYFEIGKSDRKTDIVLTDAFLSDLPNTVAFHPSLDAYVAALASSTVHQKCFIVDQARQSESRLIGRLNMTNFLKSG